MSIKCKSCTYKMSTFEFLGCLTAELFEVLKGRLTRRSAFDGWDQFMAGFSNDKKIACPICEKYVAWVSEAVDIEIFNKSSKERRDDHVQ